MAKITANGAEFYYEIHGSGYPVVLVAGYTCDSQFWSTITNELSELYQVVVFDNRGIGQTQDDGVSLSADLMASDVIALCEALNLKMPHLIGHSMGGTIVQKVALNHPNKISKIAILNSSSKWRKAMINAFRSLLNMREQNLSFDLIFEATVPWIYDETFLQSSENTNTLKNALLNNPYPQSLANQIRQFKVLENFDTQGHLSKILAPTLVGYGTEDIVSLPEDSIFIANKIPNAKLVAFDYAHGITQDSTQQLTKELLQFFAN